MHVATTSDIDSGSEGNTSISDNEGVVEAASSFTSSSGRESIPIDRV